MSRAALLTKTFESLESGLVLARGIGQGTCWRFRTGNEHEWLKPGAWNAIRRGVSIQSAEVFALPLRVERARWDSRYLTLGLKGVPRDVFSEYSQRDLGRSRKEGVDLVV